MVRPQLAVANVQVLDLTRHAVHLFLQLSTRRTLSLQLRQRPTGPTRRTRPAPSSSSVSNPTSTPRGAAVIAAAPSTNGTTNGTTNGS